jgi:hypothetical protein
MFCPWHANDNTLSISQLISHSSSNLDKKKEEEKKRCGARRPKLQGNKRRLRRDRWKN